jgi:hypothetical protein
MKSAMARQPSIVAGGSDVASWNSETMSSLITVLVVAIILVIALGLAYVPMRLLVSHMARNVREFIARQRDRRTRDRETPDRRKEVV